MYRSLGRRVSDFGFVKRIRVSELGFFKRVGV